MSTPRVQTSAQRDALDEAAPALHVVTFGCQMNKYDSLVVEGRFLEHGYRLTPELNEADVVLFNTCSVREHAEERVYSWVGELKRLKKRRPELVIGVIGCMAQRAEEEVFRRAAHVDLVCGTRRIQGLPELVDELLELRREHASGPHQRRRVLATDTAGEFHVDRRGESYPGGVVGRLAIMRGCNLSCSFCIVPAVRGRVQSRPIAELLDEARWMLDGGARVVELLGQTVNSYGDDLPKASGRGRQGRPGLADLIHELQELDGLERIRLVTLHPAYLSAALARAMGECDKLERFLPLPAQAGSDDVLRRMKRGYTLDEYRRRLAFLRDEVPDVELGSDWIVGFPGESEADFAGSVALLEEVGFVQNFVFQYDERPGTAASRMPDDVPAALKKERHQRLLAVAERVGLRRHERWIGRTVEVLVEAPARRGAKRLQGSTRHNLSVSLPGEDRLLGSVLPVSIGEASAYGLAGLPA